MLISLQQQWPMHPWTGAWGWWGMMIMMVFWLVVILAVIWFIYRITKAQGWAGESSSGHESAEKILRERYARGEIDSETYQRMLDNLKRERGAGG